MQTKTTRGLEEGPGTKVWFWECVTLLRTCLTLCLQHCVYSTAVPDLYKWLGAFNGNIEKETGCLSAITVANVMFASLRHHCCHVATVLKITLLYPVCSVRILYLYINLATLYTRRCACTLSFYAPVVLTHFCAQA